MSMSSPPIAAARPAPVTLADATLPASAANEGGRDSLSQRAYAQIRHALIGSALRPGHRLILRPLAAELGLSPTPVREALLRLVSEQALSLDDRGSAVVAIMDRAGFRELIEMRGDLEARAAERAARAASAAQIDELERINDGCLDRYGRSDHAGYLEANASFHRRLCRIGGSTMTLRMLEGLWMRLGPIYALSFDAALPLFQPLAEHPHRRLIAALRARNVEAARAAALLDVAQVATLLEPNLPG